MINRPTCFGSFNCPAYEAIDCSLFFKCSDGNRRLKLTNLLIRKVSNISIDKKVNYVPGGN